MDSKPQAPRKQNIRALYLSIKLLCSACEVLVVKDTKGEQRTFKPQGHRKPDVKLYT